MRKHDRSNAAALVFFFVVSLLGGCVGQLVSSTPNRDAGRSMDTSSVDVRESSDAGADALPDVGFVDAARIDAPADSAVDQGPDESCATLTCGRNETCAAGACVCSEGFTRMGDECEASLGGSDPLTHTQEQVCAMWQESGAVTSSGFEVGGAECDPGTLTAVAINEGMRRTNAYRWLTGLGPASAAVSHAEAQGCALVSSWNSAGPQAHNPDPDAVCYTPEGAAGAGSSNIAWGSRSTVHAIDQWVEDRGNETTMGHRRWILNPPLSGVQLGLYEGGTSYGGAACMSVFGSAGTGRRPEWFAFPPPGFSPSALPITTWTFHASWSFSETSVTVTRVSDDMELPVQIFPLSQSGGFGYPNATSFRPSGWSPASGETYRVLVVAGDESATYEVTLIDCE